MNETAVIRSYILYTYSDGGAEFFEISGRVAFGGNRTEDPVGSYIVHVHADGSLETVAGSPAANTNGNTGASGNAGGEKPSERIRQILMILGYVRDHYKEYDTSATVLHYGIRYVSEKMNTARSTVMDKLCRQTETGIADWNSMVDAWLNSKDFTQIESHLKKYYSRRSIAADSKAVTEFSKTA